MCAIAGIFNVHHQLNDPLLLHKMLSLVHHRGPDESGIYHNEGLSIGSVRLSIIDLATGQQPLSNEDGTVWIVFNGEIYNYLELMSELIGKGHTFRTKSDTEVIVHLYEELGYECVKKLNGQFAFAIWDARTQTLFLARDRVGIRPLFYTQTNGALVFASEIKAIFAHPDVTAQLDPISLNQIFTFWAPLTPRTAFKDIYELPPGHYMVASRSRMDICSYWHPSFLPSDQIKKYDVEEAALEFRALFEDAVRLRRRADVPVGAYLSGGLDSTTTSAFLLKQAPKDLHTFSISFADQEFDESGYQKQAVQHLATEHSSVRCSYADIGRVFPDVIWHTEVPILRTAPAPMYMLSKLVRDSGLKVVITGEGADEILAGYNIFKEALIRQFWARQPNSDIRPLLLKKLYPYLPHLQRAGNRALRLFFGHDLTNTSDPLYSHLLRWRATARIKQFFSHDFRAQMGEYRPLEQIRNRVESHMQNWPLLSRAQYLESTIFMSGYLLSSQGDRMAMAHSVEGRYPFLDHRLIEFCARLPPTLKVRGLTEKYLLKRMTKGELPDTIVRRSKQPYRAPIAKSFLGKDAPDYVQELLSDNALRDVGIFAPKSVARLLQKAKSNKPLSEIEGMALVGIVSTQLVHRLFVQKNHQRASQTKLPTCRVINGNLPPKNINVFYVGKCVI